MLQLWLCTYSLLKFILCFDKGKDIGSDAPSRYGMNLLLLLAHTHHFFVCLIFSLLRSLEKPLLCQLVLDQGLRELIDII